MSLLRDTETSEQQSEYFDPEEFLKQYDGRTKADDLNFLRVFS